MVKLFRTNMLAIATFFSERTQIANTTKSIQMGVNPRLHPIEILDHYPQGARRGPDSEPDQIWPVFMVAASAQIRQDKRPTGRNVMTKNVPTRNIEKKTILKSLSQRCPASPKIL